ncbi:MAG: branched-chain amino acid aminotransferase [Chitinophagaceae bacterium]|nr:branched-chain amino acid aminotransferase [Chitinophagaceae bacterium]
MQSVTTFPKQIEISPVLQSRYTQSAAHPKEFGEYISDHMFVCDYRNGAWQEPLIVPYGDMSLSPCALALHYGQSVFEGMKAFRLSEDSATIFRIEKHYERFKRSLERMCMPVPGAELFKTALIELIRLDRKWIPDTAGASLYIRPLIFASEGKFGVKVSSEYRFVILTGPVPALFSKPIRVKVETEFHRATPGGTGFAKCAGNYGGAFYPTQLARQQGFDQVIWTSAGDNPCVEESGMMNLLFIINNTLVTAPKSDTILDGITRDSLLTLARDKGWKVEEREITLRELEEACRTQQLQEAFGAGTAAIVAPIGIINIYGVDYPLPEVTPASRMFALRDALNDIRLGKTEDRFGWNTLV